MFAVIAFVLFILAGVDAKPDTNWVAWGLAALALYFLTGGWPIGTSPIVINRKPNQ